MKTAKRLLTIVLILCSPYLSAQNTVLWKVTSNANKNVSYLLGTYHLLGSSFVDSYPVLAEKIKGSDIVVTETKIDRAKITGYYNARPSSNTLSTILPKEDVDFITSVFSKSQVDVAKLTPGELFFRLQAALPRFKCAGLNADEEWMMDEYIQKMGTQQQKKLYFLETDSMQLEILNRATKLYSWNYLKAKAPALLQQYRSGTPDETLCALTDQYTSFAIDYKFDEKCSVSNSVKKRNEDWMEKLPALMESNNCFIAVGLSHLYSKCGVIEELKKLGYNIEPVKMK